MRVLARVIEELRRRCSPFEGRVAGACEWTDTYYKEYEAPGYPCGYVVLENEEPEENKGQTAYLQDVKVNFGVIVLVDNEDPRGQTALSKVEEIRPEIFKVILNWTPDEDYIDPIEYEGLEVIYLDRARMAVRFDFAYYYHLGDEDCRHGDDLEALPPYQGADVEIPLDKKLSVEGKFDVEQ